MFCISRKNCTVLKIIACTCSLLVSSLFYAKFSLFGDQYVRSACLVRRGTKVTKGYIFSELGHDHSIRCSNSIPGNGMIPQSSKEGRGGCESVVTVLR